jgi:hypothetical protein
VGEQEDQQLDVHAQQPGAAACSVERMQPEVSAVEPARTKRYDEGIEEKPNSVMSKHLVAARLAGVRQGDVPT